VKNVFITQGYGSYTKTITEADCFNAHKSNKKNECQNHTKWDTIFGF